MTAPTTPYPIATIADAPPGTRQRHWVAMGRAFGWEAGDPLNPMTAAWDACLEPERTVVALDGETVAGTAGVFSLDMTVPGGAVVPVAAVTGVSVTSTYRRRRVLTSLMQRQLTDVVAQGREAFCALWASEPMIYGRFGYGAASWRQRLVVDLARSAFSPAGAELLAAFDGRLRLVERPAADPLIDAVVRRVQPLRAGALTRPAAHAARVVVHGPKDAPRQHLLAEDAAGGPVGWASFSLELAAPTFRPDGQVAAFTPDGTATLHDLLAATPAAYAALWRSVLDLDLMAVLSAGNRPAPDPLTHLLVDPRRLHPAMSDNLWVRIVDVPRALSERAYAADVDVVLDVTDTVLPSCAGRWRVRAAGGEARVEQAEGSEPDLRLGIAELSAAHLGGTTLADLALAARVVELRPGSLAAASAAWAWSPAPHCPTMF